MVSISIVFDQPMYFFLLGLLVTNFKGAKLKQKKQETLTLN